MDNIEDMLNGEGDKDKKMKGKKEDEKKKDAPKILTKDQLFDEMTL